MASLFLSWLHLYGNLSMQQCNTAQSLLLRLLNGVQDSPTLDNLVPVDIWTILKSKLNVKLEKIVCFPTCFSLYCPPNLTNHCKFQETPRALPCGTELFKEKKMFVGSAHQGKFQTQRSHPKPTQFPIICIPTSLFIIQSFHLWIKWFISIPTMESDIEAWKTHLQQHDPKVMIDIQQGEAWKSLAWCECPKNVPSLNLVFSLFVNWFNPRTNKLAGKQQSVGIIAMSWPQAPSMTTISHLLQPLVNQLLDLLQPTTFQTSQHPLGQKVQVWLLPLIGDTGATHKVASFALHLANYFCCWCHATKDTKEELCLGPPRNAAKVLQISEKWKQAKTIKGQDELLQKAGVCYSELNQLPYCDPVAHVTLGFMHNWLEGVLAHHFREPWGFQSLSFKENWCQGYQSNTPRKWMQLEFDEDKNNSESNEDEETSDFELNQGTQGGLMTNKEMDFFLNGIARYQNSIDYWLYAKRVGSSKIWEAKGFPVVCPFCLYHSPGCRRIFYWQHHPCENKPSACHGKHL